MKPNNSLIVACGDVVVVAAMRNATVASDVVVAVGVATADYVVVVVGAMAVVVVWVQWCLMRPCISPQFAFVLEVLTSIGKELSWWDR